MRISAAIVVPIATEGVAAADSTLEWHATAVPTRLLTGEGVALLRLLLFLLLLFLLLLARLRVGEADQRSEGTEAQA